MSGDSTQMGTRRSPAVPSMPHRLSDSPLCHPEGRWALSGDGDGGQNSHNKDI
eukprot:CAMPEP_0172023588 /NCGR_PEP_ID=MMETSP1041-20130122/14869_1 /TAXON_ID=464988 /ORGANISM="Hemiselmis andersenii, Strain CCMP439" /LENGTH=52 /DNA_ID=CAMNT_0012679077 /DNA_START=228 /DNA_END=386 /DNA_ORIENTATION=+